MSSSPQRAGIRTFLIADVRGYTAFTQSRGDEAAAQLATKFAEIAREGVEAHHGDVVELRGDEALAVFTSAREAIRAAVGLQLVYADEFELDPTMPLRVGMGLDAGEAVPVDGGYRGGALNLAARLCSQAQPGEVLVSQGVTHLARALEGISVHEHGELELKGLAEPVRVLLAAPDGVDPEVLRRRFDANGRSPVAPSELPRALDPVTPIVGRDAETRRLRWAWRSARRGKGSALFLAGPSGIGKTRLASEVASTASANGASVTYASFADSSYRTLPMVGADADSLTSEAAALWVLDDLESASESDIERALELASEANGTRRLALCIFDDERASSELAAAAQRLAGEERIVRPQPLDFEGIRGIATLYLGSAVDTLPTGLLESTGGVPQRVHEQVSDWAHAEATRRLGAYASEAAVGRTDLRSVEQSLASSVVDLQFVQEQARLFGAGPGRSALDAADAPYKGLASFETRDADRFFGRERLVAELISRLAGATFLGVVGPSGSGKSSAVRAGLIPALAAGVLPSSERWSIALMRPGEHPLRELDRTLFSSLDRSLLDRIAGEDLPLRALRDTLADGERVVLVVDQFEETFTACADEEARAKFLSALTEATADPRRNVIVVVALRADYYGRFAVDPALAQLLGGNHVLVGPLSADEFRRVIEQPALSVGARIEPALTDRLVEEVLGEPGALPLLSTALLELWERRDGRAITQAAYASTGGVQGAVARLAEDAYSGLSSEQQPIVRAVLLRLAGPGEGRSVVRRRVPLSEFDVENNADVSHVLRALTARRLVTVSDGSVEVSHEALLREWPRFQAWLEEDREGRRLHAHLAETAREWAEREHDPAELYRGARLSSALDWTTEHNLELNDLEREFVNASRAENERELTEQRRRNQRLKGLLVGVGALLALAVVAGAAALVARSNATHSATVAIARQLGAEAVSEPRFDRAMLLAREGLNLNRSSETEGTLLATLLRSPQVVGVSTMPITKRPLQLAVSPDGQTLAVNANSGELLLFDTQTHQQSHAPVQVNGAWTPTYTPDGRLLVELVFNPPSPGLHVLSAKTLETQAVLPFDSTWMNNPTSQTEPYAISPDGRTAYLFYSLVDPVHGTDGPAYLDRWDVATKKLKVFPLGSNGMLGARLTADGRRIVTVTDTAITTWDATTMKPLHSVRQPVAASPDVLRGAEVSPDGQRVLLSSGAAVTFVDARTGKARPAPTAHTADVQSVAWLPNSREVVTTGDDARVVVWDAVHARPIEMLLGHGGRIAGAAVAADGRTLYTSSLDGAIFAWDLGTASRFGKPFHVGSALPPNPPPDTPPTPPLALAGDSRLFAARVGPSRVGLFALPGLRQVQSFDVGRQVGAVTALAFSPTAKLIAVSGDDAHVQLWDVGGTPRLLRSFVGLPRTSIAPKAKQPLHEAPQALAFSPDGTLLAAVDVKHTPGSTPADGHLVIWQVGSGRAVAKPLDLGRRAEAVAFSAEGSRLAVGLEDKRVLIVDPKTGRITQTLHAIDEVTALDFAPDGTLEVGTWAGIVQHFDSGSGKELGHPTLVTPSPVASLFFDPSGKTFSTTGGSDGTAKLWTTSTQQQLGTSFQSDPGRWGSASYTPNGKYLVVVYDDGTGFLWPAQVGAWADHACAIAGRNFTREEWSRFVSGHSYAKTCPQFPAG